MYPDSLSYIVNCSIIFTELPILERPAAAKKAGFDAIEMWWPFPNANPSTAEVDAFVQAVTDAGVSLRCMNLFAGDMGAGERGVASWPGRESEFSSALSICAGVAKRLGTSGFNTLYGCRLPDVSPEEQDELATNNLGNAAKVLGDVGAVVLIEPLSGDQPYPLRTGSDAVAVVQRVRESSGQSNIAFLADLYHLATNGDDVGQAIRDHHRFIEHVQIADVPGRHQPGTGTLDIEEFLNQLAGLGYSAAVGLEYIPEGPSEESFSWLADALRR